MLDTCDPHKALALAALVAGRAPALVSAHAFEREGVNAIPEVFAKQLGKLLGWPVESGIVQTNVVSHTGANGFWRLARQAEFENVFTAHPGPRKYPFGRSAALRRLPIASAMGCTPRLASHPEWAFARLPAGQ